MDPSMNPRIYLDHAATCVPKRPEILQAMHSFSSDYEAAAGRGSYRSSQQAGNVVARIRHEIASWIGAADDDEISMHAGGTAAINTALFGILRPGDHVVTTTAEHNSVLRPLHHLVKHHDVTWTVLPTDSRGQVSCDSVLAAVTPQTRMVAVVHAANVNGVIQPVQQIGRRLQSEWTGATKPIFLSDAAQSFGHLPLSVTDGCVDVLAAPGHKGGCGPLGTGFLYVRKELHHAIRPLILGGTGTRSESLEMPNDYPSSFEAGNINVPALAGWLAGLQSRSVGRTPQQALEESAMQLAELATRLYDGLDQISGLRIIGRPASPLLPVASIAIDALAASDAAMILDSEFGIEVRSGLHCAALIHQAIGSPADGTLRISCGESTTSNELQQLMKALAEICR